MAGRGRAAPNTVSAAVVVNASTRRKVEALYTSDNWAKRRRVLFHAIYGQFLLALIIIGISMWAAITRQGINTDLLGTLNTIVVPSLLLSASSNVYTYVFGANADDQNKRENMPAPVVPHVENATAPPPEE